MLNSIKNIFRSGENKIIAVITILLALDSVVYLSKKSVTGIFPRLPVSLNVSLFGFFALAVIFGGTVLFFSKNIDWKNIIKKTLIVFSLAEAVFIFAIQQTVILNPWINILVAGYVLLLLIYLIVPKNFLAGEKNPKNIFFSRIKPSFTGENFSVTAIILAVMLVNLFFGLHNLGKFAAVDEPLWLFQRIPLFWQNVENMNWKSAKVSDKPGLTVAAVSGIGLLSENNPQQHKKEYTGTGKTEKNIEGAEKLNLIFRTPLFLFVLLLLPLFYFILKNYVGKSAALLAFVFLGLSPIIIGNSQIVNPDGILWTLSSLSLLAYLSYLSSNKRALLLASAIFLGFALLTKYTANILYIFFLFLIFAEYILNYQNYAGESAGNYLKERLKKYALLVIISFGVIFVFYPVVWAVPKKLFSLTIQSQPFAPVWPFFGTLLLFIFFDTFVLKSFVISPLLKIIAKTRRLIVYLILTAFLAIVFAVFFNVYNGMKPYDFMQLLASPKTSFRGTSLMEMFSTNFYSLIFGIHPLAILSLLTFLAVSAFRKKIEDKKFIAVIFLILFISVYYSGSVFSKVASTIRYQISLYPPILIAAGIALSGLLTLMSAKLDELQKRLRLKLSNAGRYLAVSVILLVILSSVLYLTEPFEMGYASSLLPKKYFLDVKDMGEGSYEASEFLNSLDNAKNITVWTDKKGVCTFFVGLCYTGFDKKLAQIPYNYFVVSSGRDSRTSNLTAYWKYFNIDFNALYAIKDTVYKLEINGRPGSYVKIIDAKIAPPFIWLPK